MWKPILICGIALFVGVSLPLAKEDKMRFLPGAEPMKQEILRFVPVGTGVDAARHIMEENRFACDRKSNADFMATDQATRTSKFLQKKNYLYCDYTQPGFILSADRRWQVALIIEAGKISEIYVSYGLIAL